MPFTEIRGRKIYYEMHGDGDTVLLLHHGFASAKMWKEIYPSIVAAGYRVVVYDRRGYGQSDPGPDFEEFWVSDTFVDENVKDLAELIKALNLDPFSIVGQCEGGVVGMEYAGRFPLHVKALAVASTLCFSQTTLIEFNKLKFPKSFQELEPDIRDKMIRWHGSDHAEPLYEMARTRGGAYGSGFFDFRPRLPFVTCPTLILYPDRSALFEVEQAVAFYRLLQNAELAVIPRCGHNTYDQKPEEYIGHVLNFLNRTSHETGKEEVDYSMTCIAPAPPRSESG